MTEQTARKVPSIRFKGFEGEWKKYKLGSISECYSGGTPSVSSKSFYNGKIPFIRSGEINSNTTEITINESGLNNTSAKLVSKGCILYALYGATSGEVGISKIDGAINQAILAIKPNKNYSVEFIEKWLRKQKNFIVKTFLQGGQGNLSGEIIKSLMLPVPAPEEQTKIGTYFKNLDQLIELHQQKYKKLLTLKKAMLQKMFPKEGATSPEIRFKGFEDSWKIKKLKDISKRAQGNDGRMSLPTLTISAARGWLDQRERFFDNIAGSEQKNYTLLKKGELSYNKGNSKTAKFGVVFELTNFSEALVPRVYHSFKILHNNSASFIEYLFHTKIPDNELSKLISSGARMDGLLNISFSDFIEIPVLIPEPEEQQKIGNYFRKLDTLISQQATQLKKLKQIKAACLEKMFV